MATFCHQSCASFGIVGHVGARRRPRHARRAAVELDQTAELRRHLGHRARVWMSDLRIGVSPTMNFFSEVDLGDRELGVEPRRLAPLQRRALQHRPRARVLIAELHALFPVGAVRRRRHAPLGRAVRVHHRQSRLGQRRVKAVYQKICCAISPWPGTGPASENVMPRGLGRRVLLQPVDVLGQRVDGGRAVGFAAARHRGAGRVAALDADAPLVHRLAVGDALVAHARHATATRR